MKTIKPELNFKKALNSFAVGVGAFFYLTTSLQATATTVTSTQTGAATLQKGATVKPTLLIAQQNRTRRIQFTPGKSSATVEDAVVRGTRDIYLVGARKGQTMTLNITSLENNAVFDVIAPNGQTVRQEATSWKAAVPATGDYRIVVGGTRGNASYKLVIGIR